MVSDRAKVGDIVRAASGTRGIVKRILHDREMYHVQWCTNEFGIRFDGAEVEERGRYQLNETTGNMEATDGRSDDE